MLLGFVPPAGVPLPLAPPLPPGIPSAVGLPLSGGAAAPPLAPIGAGLAAGLLDLLFPRPAGGPSSGWTPDGAGPPWSWRQMYDLFFEERLSSRTEAGRGENGEVIRDSQGNISHPPAESLGDWISKQINDATEWWHVSDGYTNYVPLSQTDGRTVPVLMGINAKTFGWPNGISSTGQGAFNGRRAIGGGIYGLITYSSEIRNFRIRRAGSSDEPLPYPLPPVIVPTRPGPVRADPVPAVVPPVAPVGVPGVFLPEVAPERRRPVPAPPLITEPTADPAGPGDRPPVFPEISPVPISPVRPDPAPATPASPPVPVPVLPVPAESPPSTLPRAMPIPEVKPVPSFSPEVTPADALVTEIGTTPIRTMDVPPTLQGIALKLAKANAELDEIRKRLEEGSGGGDGGGGAKDVMDALERYLGADVAGGSYQMPRPCQRDEMGQPVGAATVPVPPAETQIGGVLARLDALAILLAEHKVSAQPVCGRGGVTGSPVTVTFVSVEDDGAG